MNNVAMKVKNMSYSMYVDTEHNIKKDSGISKETIHDDNPDNDSSSFDVDSIINDIIGNTQNNDELILSGSGTCCSEDKSSGSDIQLNMNSQIEKLHDIRPNSDKINIISKLGASPPRHNIECETEQVKNLSTVSRRISRWVEDSSVTHCYNCNNEFTFITRRHHCRLCGRVFCHFCSNYYAKLPLDILQKIPDKSDSYGNYIWMEKLDDNVRVCGKCFSHVSQLLRIRKIIKVFELCRFDIRDLYILSKINPEWENASNFCLSKFREIQYKLSIEKMTKYEKKMLWINRNYLTGHSRWMVQLVKATDLRSEIKTRILEKLLYCEKKNICWDIMCTRFCSVTIGLTDILDLIKYNRNYNVISELIIKCMMNSKIEDLQNYLPFLVLNIKNNEFILDLLITKGCDNFVFMSNIYWCVKVYCNNFDEIRRYITKLLIAIKERQTKEFRNRFKEMIRMEKIDIEWLHLLNERCRIILPLFPNKDFVKVENDKIKTMSSHSRPAIIPFIDSEGNRKLVMYKNDDIRKDYIVINIINIIHKILKEEESMDIITVKYDVIPTSKKSGYIEIVENASTIFNIIEKSKLSIQNYIWNNNKHLVVGDIRDKFIKSTALYCVISYLLGIGDRHLDNIMISQDGLLFHIDFGYILGQDPKYTNNRFIRVTPEIINVIGGEKTDDYQYFKKCCVKIYNRLRLHVNLFSNLLSVVPIIDPSIDDETIKKELVERFEIGENCIEAATHMDNKVENKNDFEYMIIDFLYKAKQNAIIQGISYVKDSIFNILGKNKS